MARGPFQGTFQPNLRPTVVHGPDALVYINGETDVIGCPSCRRKFDFNSYITSVTADLSVDSAPGSASITLSIPRHAVDDFYFEGNALVTPMMEIEIFAKGYYLVEGVPQYYPIFWGLVTEVGNSYSGGEHTVSIQCSDILKWWELCKMNINPAFTGAAGQEGRNIFGNVFFGMNPFDVIWTCAQQAFGDVVVGSGSLVSLVKENGGQKQVFTEALGDIMAYWEARFARTRGNLLLYGTNGVAVRGDSLYEAWTTQKKGEYKKPFASTAVRNANGGKDGGQMVFDPTDPQVVAFRTQFSQAGQVNFWTSEYQTKLELANAAKEAIGYEFFMDVTGDIVFKPPFFNLDILSNKPVSWIQDIDVIDWDFSESESEVVTQLTLQGSYGGNVDYSFPEDITPFTSVTDYHLLRKYGWRSHTLNSEFMGDTQLMFYYGLDVLDRINSKRHRGTVTIPMRPELRLGFPIYVAPLDQVWYVSGISHNLSFGGRAQTTLTLTAKRQKFFAPRGIGTLRLDKYVGPTAAAQAPAKTDPKAKNAKGKQKGQPAPDVKLPFKYTSRQLSKYALFTVNPGTAASIPPTLNRLESVSKDNPYAPLILRHPKTGRAVGYPNVNLIYTRPFAPTKEQLAKSAGQKPNGAITAVNKQTEGKMRTVLPTLLNNQLKATTYTGVDVERDRLLSSRYQYGLNSAGVFIYVYDLDHTIGEVTFVPAVNIRVKYDSGKSGAPLIEGGGNAQGMIRPISDNRGFEVIGHFRYGRGLSLRDGRLVYNQGEKNRAASVGIQSALSGDLFASLSAQAQGVTTLATTAPNPIDAITRLAPADMQTAGILNPSTKKPEFVTSEPNFIDAAPLGSPEQDGQASVEANQLSRALTIAELGVLKDSSSGDTKCGCIAGRSDLAFMNLGYQVSNIDPTQPVDFSGPVTPEPSVIEALPVAPSAKGDKKVASKYFKAGVAAGNEDRFDEAVQLFKTADAILHSPNTTRRIAQMYALKGDTANAVTFYKQYVQEKPDDTISAGILTGLEAQLKNNPAPDPIKIPPIVDVRTRVDEFLFNLYSALDKPHQEVEAALRGELLDVTLPSAEETRFGSLGSPPSELSPPFNPANRLAVGDPQALAAQASSAASDLKQTWTDFGGKLQKNTKRAKLQTELNNAGKELGEVNKELDMLRKQQERVEAGDAVVLAAPPLKDQIATLEKKQGKLQQQVKDLETSLQQT